MQVSWKRPKLMLEALVVLALVGCWKPTGLCLTNSMCQDAGLGWTCDIIGHCQPPDLAQIPAPSMASFKAATNFPIGRGAESMAVGDFNGDMKSDLAVANGDSNDVSVLLGDGSGGFGPAITLIPIADDRPRWVAVGDFNGDRKADLAILMSANVSVLLGNGAGGFGPATNFSASGWSLTVGDFNGDMNTDLAIAAYGDKAVSVLLGNGSGSFSTATEFPVEGYPLSVAVGDFNGDMRPDLAAAVSFGDNVSDSVSVLLGNGAGGFGAATKFPVGSVPYSVALGDFNGDMKLDLAVAIRDVSKGHVSVLLGNGSGSFGAAIRFQADVRPGWVTVGDFNGDLKPDLAVTNDISNDVSVLLGDGLGGFGFATNIPVGRSPSSVVVGDFNSDQKLDLAVANRLSYNVSVLLNQSR